MIVVTGGAGFIGSALVHALNQKGISDILVVDLRDHPEKEKNLKALQYGLFLGRDEFLRKVQTRSLKGMEAIFHLGACSSTTETDEEYLARNNFEYTRELAIYALEQEVRFIYASSAATYGNGEAGYSDDETLLDRYQPLNPYGWSKHRFDLWARDKGLLKKIVGLKYFNVFGPNEYHKGEMRSMVLKGYEQIRDTGRIRLFKSYRAEYPDGGQVRDFIHVRDAVAMTLFFLNHPEANGLYNIGSGRPRSWNDLAAAIFSSLGKPVQIDYIEMPPEIRDQYQYHTCADISKIRSAGYNEPITPLEVAVRDYVQNFLTRNRRLGSPE